MCKRDREYTDAELSAENAQYRFANLCRAAQEEGRRLARVEMASNMLKAGMSVDLIKSITHLTDAEIAAL
ncbi:MAG TPA: hypothetical protein H9850_05330 [Candidatus Anaerobiospirillum pullistercoris]|uniref:Uncharacterized protein n=1 Tax=Candidatus Anaerobiospirillum pullistercoris TaxID=2838452 RepID=A0A9D2B0R1_9GAMM|nr:hypothetical protein [Candidatus Anaerobiospirillum pullistercoris]